jgi:hypothetical protein
MVLAWSVAPVPALAGQPPDSIGIQLLDVPKDRQQDPRARLYIVDRVAPGATFTRRLKVTNTTEAGQHVQVYPGAATVADGEFEFAPERAGNDLTGWISLDRGAVDLDSGQATTVKATFRVPDKASSGERYAVIWASVASSSPDASSGILVNRVGIRVYLDIGSGGDPVTDFQIDEVVAGRGEDGRPSIAAQVRNTGARTVDIGGSVRLTHGPRGLTVGPQEIPPKTTLAPGDGSWIETWLASDVPDGPWTVHLSLVSGDVERTFTATVTFPAAGAPPVTVRPAIPQRPLANVLVLLAFLSTVVGFALLRRLVFHGRLA